MSYISIFRTNINSYKSVHVQCSVLLLLFTYKSFCDTISERTTIQHTLLLWQLFSVIDVKNGRFVIIYPSIYILFFFLRIFIFLLYIVGGEVRKYCILFYTVYNNVSLNVHPPLPSTHTSYVWQKKNKKIRSVVLLNKWGAS